jgi:predicted nucleotidyltransferase
MLKTRKRSSLIEALRNHLEARPEILFAYLHGSFLTGGPYRDIDVAAWVDPTGGRDRCSGRYALDLSVVLHLALGEPVDVQVLNDAPLAVRYHALKGQPLVVRDWDFLDQVRARTWDDYFDFLPFARQYLREVLSA